MKASEHEEVQTKITFPQEFNYTAVLKQKITHIQSQENYDGF